MSSPIVVTKKYDKEDNCVEKRYHLVQIDKLDLLKFDHITREKTVLNTGLPEITKQAFMYQRDSYTEAAELLFSKPRFFFTAIKYCMSQPFPQVASNGHPSSRYIKVSEPTLLESFRSMEKILNVNIVKNSQPWTGDDTQGYVTMKVTADTVFNTEGASYKMDNLPSKYNTGNIVGLYFKLYNVSSSSEERNINKDFIEIDTIWVRNSVRFSELYFNTDADD